MTTAGRTDTAPVYSPLDAQRHVVAAATARFAAAGVGAFETARPTLDAIKRLEDEQQVRRHAADEHVNAIAQRLADGTLDVDGAALELAAAAVPRLDEAVEQAVRGLTNRLQSEVARDVVLAVDALTRMLAPEVESAVTAGRACCDMDAVMAAFRGHEYRLQVPALLARASMQPDWPTAVKATARVRELRRLVDVLTPLGGPPVRFWSGKRPIGLEAIVSDLVPEPLILAVGAGLGWQPGLTFAPDRRPRPIAPDAGREARAEVMRRAPVLGALRHRIDQIATGQG